MQVFGSLVVELAFDGEWLSCCFILHWDLSIQSCFWLEF
jgi:hypothetical protein